MQRITSTLKQNLTANAIKSISSRTLSTHLPLSAKTEDESMLRDMVSQFAADNISPKVSSMDESSTMCPDLIKSLFDNGLMGVEVPEEYGGSGASFTAMCSVIEEIAKVDPAVATCVDVHSTVSIQSIQKRSRCNYR